MTATYNNSIVIQFDTVESGNSGALKPVTVFNAGTTNKAVLTDLAGFPIDNPLQADSTGNYTFNAANGLYDIYIDYGLATQTSILNELVGEISVDVQLINDLSQAYEFDTIDLLEGTTITFPLKKVLSAKGGLALSDGGFSSYVVTAGSSPEPIGSPDILGGNYAKLQSNGIVYAKQFRLKCDGTNDTTNFVGMLNHLILTGDTIDGQDLQTRLADTHNLSPTFKYSMKNWDIITGNDYTDQCNISIDTDVQVTLENIKVDGERDTRTAGTEPWSVFANFGGVDSIQPLGVGRFFRTLVYGQQDIHLNNLKFTNYHGQEAIKINSYATVFINNFKANNCSNKTYHIWHAADSGSDPDTGITIATGIDTRDCGIMSASFLVDGVAKVRADNYAPQGAFGCIVTFGRYTLNQTYVRNYGATGVTGDRNLVFTHSNTEILHNDANAFNNNPSGAFWNESCAREIGSVLEIKVTARDAREATTDSSLLQTFLLNGEISGITGLILETEVGSQIAKVIRGSHGAGAAQTITGYSVEATGSDTAIRIANVSGQSNKIALHNGRVRGGNIELNDSLDTVVTDLDSTGQLTIKPVINTPIGNVTLDNAVATGGNLILEGINGEIKINGGSYTAIRMASQFGSSFTKMSVDGGCELISFNSIITGGATSGQVQFGNVSTVRRVEFQDVQTVSVSGGIYKTTIAESILWFNPTAPAIMIHASVMGAATWIQTGTVGAGFVTFAANVGTNFDSGNDKVTIAWT